MAAFFRGGGDLGSIFFIWGEGWRRGGGPWVPFYDILEATLKLYVILELVLNTASQCLHEAL